MPGKDPRSPSGKPPGAGWRRTPKAPPPGGRSSPRKSGGWTKKKDRDYQRAALRHRVKIAAWSLLFVVLMVGFIVWLIPRPVSTPLLVAVVTNYESPIPPNAWAREDVERLLSLKEAEIVNYPETIGTASDVTWQSKSRGWQRLLEQLDELQPGGPRKDVVIIYLSMHGVVDEAAEPCLLPPGALKNRASRFDTKQWLRVRDLLDDLKGRPGKARNPDKVKKLLILDSNRMDVNWSLGLLYNGFADRLQAVIKEADVPGLVVLNSTSPGQIGWAAPELQGSVFGYFLWQGLKGAADENGNGKVSLEELHHYLKAHVGTWVRENRADVQEPMLLTNGADDFELVHARTPGEQWPTSNAASSAPESKTARDPRWNEVATLWRQHAKLLEGTPSPYRTDPLGWAEFEQKLLRLEQLVQAGKAYEREFSDTKRDLESLAVELAGEKAGRRSADQGASAQEQGEVAAYSLPLARRLGGWPNHKQRENAHAHWMEFLRNKAGEKAAPKTDSEKPPPEKAENKATPEKPGGQGDSEKTSPQPPQQAPNGPVTRGQGPEFGQYGYLAASAECWDWSIENPSTSGRRTSLRRELSGVVEFVDAARPRPKTDLIELYFLRMLKEHLDTVIWETGSDYVKRALTARGLAEHAAAPADERTHYWIKGLVNEADGKRRLAEDKLFVGTEDALAEAEGLQLRAAGSEETDDGYHQAVRRAKQVAAAFELRDRAWGQTPYLAQWLLARLHQGNAEQLDHLRDLIEGTHQLAAELDELLRNGRWPGDLLKQEQNTLDARLKELKTAFDEECSRLKTAGEDKETLRAITIVLAVPLVTGTRRNELRETYLAIAGSTGAAGTGDRITLAEDHAGEVAAEEQGELPVQYLNRLRRWDEHPALGILSRAKLDLDTARTAGPVRKRSNDQSQPDHGKELLRQVQLRQLAEQGENVRRLLKSVRGEAETRLGETERMLDPKENPDQSSAAARAGRSQADRLVRAAAVLLAGRPWDKPGADPVHLLRDLDLHYLLLWHGERTLDDFWGPKRDGERSYFEIVAEEYLESAKKLCKSDLLLQRREDALSRSLALRKSAARQGVQPAEAKDIFIDSQEKQQSIEHHVSVTAAANLPPGEAAVYLQNLEGLLLPLLSGPGQTKPDLRRKGIQVERTAAHQPLDYWVPNNDRLKDVLELEAIALYRGHRSPCTFRVQSATGLDIDYFRPKYRQPRLTVYGKARQRKTIILILDCSGTMGTSGRMGQAKAALAHILSRLIDRDNPYHVGVMLYGHRVGWNRQIRNQIVVWNPQPPWQLVPRPPGLNVHPSADVEWILTPGRFADVEMRMLRTKLDSLRPLGVTPLYLAILKAIEYRTKHPKHIVAITDGVNNQRSQKPDPPPGVIKNIDHLNNALQLRRNGNIRLDVLGFNLVAQNPEQKKDLQDLKGLSVLTGGAFFDVSNTAGLTKALEESLQLRQYEVQSARTGEIVAGPEELGRACVIDQAPDRKQAYLARIRDLEPSVQTEFDLWPGEWLKLYLTDDLRRLVHRRYELERRRFFDNIPDPLDKVGRAFYIAAHLPKWERSGVRFYLSVQNSDQQRFSPRPEEAWVRITPDPPPANEDAPGEYSFYDVTYEPGCPVPVLSCLAPKWPVEAKKAKVELWCKLQKTRPDLEVTVGRSLGQSLRLEGAPNVTFEVDKKRGRTSADPYQVIVNEQHPPDTDLYSVKVEMSPAPEKVRHYYNRKTGTVRHTFYYDDSVATEVENYRVLLTTRKKLFDRAIKLPGPLVVDVPED